MKNILSEMQRSALLEAGNIGSGHAAIALSQLMGRKIMIAIPSIEIVEFHDLKKVIPNGGRELLQVVLGIYGDARGAMLFVLDKETSMILCDMVMGQERGKTTILGDLEMSALKEVGSIVSASYLNAISEMTGVAMMVSVPDCTINDIDHLGDVLANKNVEIGDVESMFCIRTEFIQMDTKIDGYLLFMPIAESAGKIIKNLGL